MKSLSRTFAMVISFQLIVGCNGEMFALKGLPPGVSGDSDDSVEISGSIARSFRSISNFIMPSAMAAEGSLSIYDASNPNEPSLLHQEEISGKDDFAVKFDRKLIDGKILKINFESHESQGKSRSLLWKAVIADDKVGASLDENSSVKSRLVEAQLKKELERGDISSDGIGDRLASLQVESFDDINLLGDMGIMSRMFQNPDLASVTWELIEMYRKSVDMEERAEILRKLYEYAQKYEVVGEKILLQCSGPVINMLAPNNGKEFSVIFEPKEEQARNDFGERIEWGNFSDIDYARELMKQISGKYNDFSKSREENFSAEISIYDNEKNLVSSCLMHGLYPVTEEDQAPVGLVIDKRILNNVSFKDLKNIDHGRELFARAFEETIEELSQRLMAAKIEKGSEKWEEIFNEQYDQAKKHYYVRYEALEAFYGTDQLAAASEVAAVAEIAKE